MNSARLKIPSTSLFWINHYTYTYYGWSYITGFNNVAAKLKGRVLQQKCSWFYNFGTKLTILVLPIFVTATINARIQNYLDILE